MYVMSENAKRRELRSMKEFIFRNRPCWYELNSQDNNTVINFTFAPNADDDFIDENGDAFFYIVTWDRSRYGQTIWASRNYENEVVDDWSSYFSDTITNDELDYIEAFINSLLEEPELTMEPELIPTMETKKYMLKITYSWGDEESDILFPTWEEAWKTAKEYAMKEADDFSREHEDTTNLVIEQGKITLYYHAWNECCNYEVVEVNAND